MRSIKSIHIKNFRSIVDEKIELEDYTCFVGLNDSGKSNVLKALNLFFNGETDYGTTFNFIEDYSKFAKRGAKQAKEIVIELEIIVPESFREHGIKVWKKTWRMDGLHSDNASELLKGKGNAFLSRIKYLYIPAVKSKEYFRSLLSDVYTSMSQTADGALAELNRQYSGELQRLTASLSEQIKGVLGLDSSLKIPNDLSILFRNLTFSTSDADTVDIDLNHRGDGIKARYIPTILRFIQEKTESSRPKRSVYGTYVWGFEEPENGLEYMSCFEMAEEFMSYTDDCQILITTHSPAFYMKSQEKQHECILTKKENGKSVYTIDDGSEASTVMGLMQMIAPFINEAKRIYAKDHHQLLSELCRVMDIMKRRTDDLDSNQVLSILECYSSALELLDAYDHMSIEKPQETFSSYVLTYDECREYINQMPFFGESILFGNEKDDSFKSIIGNIYQSFDGVDLYPSVEEKAANLLYLITKDHSFSDGNKRIAAAIFLYFLEKNNMAYKANGDIRISQDALVALVVLVAESRPNEKETIIKLIMNIISRE